MSDIKIEGEVYCSICFHKLKRIIGGYGCEKCGLLCCLWPEELGMSPLSTERSENE